VEGIKEKRSLKRGVESIGERVLTREKLGRGQLSRKKADFSSAAETPGQDDRPEEDR